MIDTWADDDPNGGITITNKRYYGLDSPGGCGNNSAYDITWFVQHWRGWGEVTDEHQHALHSDVDPCAATHNGALHLFGAHNGKLVHARTFTGATWQVNELGSFGRNDLFHVNPQSASAVSFNDRLYVFVVADDGSVVILTYTTDGGSWSDAPPKSPTPLQTWLAPTTVVFGNRLYVFARERTSGMLQFTSTSDFLDWRPWTDVPTVGAHPSANAAVAAAVLDDQLLLFGINETGKPPESKVVARPQRRTPSPGRRGSRSSTGHDRRAPSSTSSHSTSQPPASTDGSTSPPAGRIRTSHRLGATWP